MLNYSFLVIISITLFLAIYSVIISYVNGFPDNYVVLRLIRCLITSFCTGLFIINYPLKSEFIIKVISNTIGVHAIFIILQIIFPQLQTAMMALTGFDKSIFMLRAFGLSAGFDSAGYLCIIGLFISIYSLIYNKVSISSILYIYLFVLAGVFTGRSVMVIMILVVILLNLYFLIKGKFLYKLFAIGNFGVGGYLAFTFIVPLLVATLPFLKDQNLISIATNDRDYSQSFASGSGDTLTEMFFIPKSIVGILFGDAVNPLDSDVGYIKLIFMIGVIGLLLTVFVYIFMFIKAIILRATIKNSTDVCDRIIYNSLISLIVCLFIFNIKTLYFMSRNFHEITLILFLTFLNTHKIDQKVPPNNDISYG